MSFIDEAAREIHVKIVWYSATPCEAAEVVRYISARTRPDLVRQQSLAVGDGTTMTHVHFVPAALGAIRGFSVRFHLYAIEREGTPIETPTTRALFFRGVDGCVLLGGAGEGETLARLDAVLAGLGCANVPIVYGGPGSAAQAEVAGHALGFPVADCFPAEATSGAGVFDLLKAVARKILGALAGNAQTGRATPAKGTHPLAVEPTSTENTLEARQKGLDAWQRVFYEKGVWTAGFEEERFTPDDLPAGLPIHSIHVLRPLASVGFSVLTNGFSRAAPMVGGQRLELRADVTRYGFQIGLTVSFLGRIWFVEQRDGGAPWLAFDRVSTAEQPVFGLAYFLLLPGGSLIVEQARVELMRIVPISEEEHTYLGRLSGEARGTWILGQGEVRDRWSAALTRERAFG